MPWGIILSIYSVIHIFCAILAYGTFFHAVTVVIKTNGNWKEANYADHVKFIIGFLALVGGPITLIIWRALAWAGGIPLGFRFTKPK